jgi:SAM-dependent methyltransferase
MGGVGSTWSSAVPVAERLIRQHLSGAPGPLLAQARTALAPGLQAVPGLTFDRMLTARTWRLEGNEAAETASLAPMPAARRAAYDVLFRRPTPELAALLDAHLYEVCQDAKAPGCGAAPPVPADFGVWEQLSWRSHSEDRLTTWVAGRRTPTTEELLKRIHVVSGARVADVGAGEGWLTFPMAATVGPTGRVTATEIDPAFVRFIPAVAAALKLPTVTAVQQTATDVSLPAGQFDVVVVCEVMKAVVNNRQMGDAAWVTAQPIPFLTSIASALAPGGRLVIIEHDDEQDPEGIGASHLRDLTGRVALAPEETIADFGPLQTILVARKAQ